MSIEFHFLNMVYDHPHPLVQEIAFKQLILDLFKRVTHHIIHVVDLIVLGMQRHIRKPLISILVRERA